jgi:DNA-binding IclR family transcriptional regulator
VAARDEAAAPDDARGGVQSVERAFTLLETLATSRDGLGLGELATATGLSKSTVHRLLRAMVERGYVAHDDRGGRYAVGLRLVEVVSVYLNSLELQTEARPYLRELTAELGLTAHLGVLDGTEVIYVERLDVLDGVRLYSQIGFRVPAHSSSLGKCLLAAMSGAQVERLLGPGPYPRFTPRTLTHLDALRADLVEVRRRGWAIDDEEGELRHRCVGAPILDYRGEAVAAISASGSTAALPVTRVPDVAAAVTRAAVAISRRLGYAG